MSSGWAAVPQLARRFLLSKVSDRFLSFIAWVSVVGVALGVLALTVVTSVINGFEGELVRVITGMVGDVVLYSRGEPITDPDTIDAKIKHLLSGVEASTRAFTTELMASGPSGVSGAIWEGMDLETAPQVTDVSKRVIRGKLPEGPGEVALGYALAEKLGVQIGNEARLIIPGVGENNGTEHAAAAPMLAPKSTPVRVVGLVRMGMYEYDSKYIFSTLPYVQEFLNQPGKVTVFKLKLKKGVDSRRASDRLNDSFGYPFRAKDWGQMNKNLLYAIKLEKAVIAIILIAIVIVAAFNVVSTLMMMIHDKTKEIAILKAMGFRKSQSFRLFCLIGTGIGLVGVLGGIGLGLGVNWVLKETRLIELPAEIYYIGYLPVVIEWHEIALIGIVALLITFVSALYPAYQVSVRSPLDGMRYE